jgi:hypothetical protein
MLLLNCKKATISFVMYICPSVRMEHMPPLDGISWNFIFEDFSEVCRQNSCLIKIRHERRELYMKTFVHLWKHVPGFFLKREIFHTKVIEKIKTHILCSITFFFENRAIYDIMEKNIEEQGRPLTTIWRMRIACWITKATYMHLEYVIFIAFLLQQLLDKYASMLHYTYIACLVKDLDSSFFFFLRVFAERMWSIYLVISVRLHLWTSVTPSGHIFITFHFWDQC